MPRFSVVIPAFNAARTVEATIRSVLAQTEAAFELIVVDDGSSDDTRERVSALADEDRRLVLIAQENRGTAGARNTGIERARGEYVSFLDNDDLWMPRYLESMGGALDAAPDAGFAYCNAWGLHDATLRILRRTAFDFRPGPAPGATHEDQVVALARANFVMSSSTVRRRALEEVGGFDETIRGTDDYDLWFRLLLAGWEAALAAPTPLLLQRDRFDSASKNALMMANGLRQVLERAAADPRMPARAVAALAPRRAEIEREIAFLSGRGMLARTKQALRPRAVALRKAVASRRLWLDRPPPEVAAAFPELATSASGRPQGHSPANALS